LFVLQAVIEWLLVCDRGEAFLARAESVPLAFNLWGLHQWMAVFHPQAEFRWQ
jgi:hypothetical protein